jgi:ABC-type multidrug transport system fused ATPase/permease subunit
MSLVFPRVVGRIMDSAFGVGSRHQLDRTVLFLLGLFFVQAVMTFTQAYLLSSAGERIIGRLREDLFALASAAEHLLVENNRLRTEHKRLTAVLGVP